MSMSNGVSSYQIVRGAPEHETARTSIPLSVRIVKRTLDIAAALAGLSLLVLLLPLLALAIYLDSPGPIFYRQRRASVLRTQRENARAAFCEFEMLKFRSMHVN